MSVDPDTMGAGSPPGDVTALFRSQRLAMVRLAVLLIDDLGLAEDLVQDAFVALHRRWPTLRDEEGARAYLRTCVVNGCRSALRRRRTARRFRHAWLDRDAPGSDERLLHDEQHRLVLSAVRQLPDRQREVIVLRYWSGLSEAEIAATLGISAGAVKSNGSRGRAAIAEWMGRNA